MVGLRDQAVRLDLSLERWTTYEGLNLLSKSAHWFRVPNRGSLVYQDGDTWTRYGVADGLMDNPRGTVTVTRKGLVVVKGLHRGKPATALFDGHRWKRTVHAGFVELSATYESHDGRLWIAGLPGGRPGTLREIGGLLRFDGREWTHLTPPDAPDHAYGIGQTADGVFWFGGTNLSPLRKVILWKILTFSSL